MIMLIGKNKMLTDFLKKLGIDGRGGLGILTLTPATASAKNKAVMKYLGNNTASISWFIKL